MLFSTYGDRKRIEQTNVMFDFPANNYIGAKSLEYNLSLIPGETDLRVHSLTENDKEYILGDLEGVLAGFHIEKIWEMLWQRWCYFEEVCGKKEP